MRTILLALVALFPCAANAAPEAGSRAAREFVQASAQSDQFEQAEAELVLTASRNAAVRSFAQRMMADHGATSRALTEAATRAGLALPPASMSADQAQLLAGLQGVEGPDLDRLYARHQMLAHHSALVVERGYASNGDVPVLKATAAAALPIITAHLSAAERLQAGLGGS